MQTFTTFDEVFLMSSNLKFRNFILFLCNNGGTSSHLNNEDNHFFTPFICKLVSLLGGAFWQWSESEW
jgi:hypothetical protein